MSFTTQNRAAGGMAALVAYQVDQPAYIINNWKQLQALGFYDRYSKPSCRIVKVQCGIATISDGESIIRSPVSVPDGFYVISEENEFVTETPRANGYLWNKMPDPDAAMPNFEALDYTPPIGKDFIAKVVEYMNYVRKMAHNENIIIEGDAMIAQGMKDSWLSLPHPVPIKGGAFLTKAALVKIVFTEMLKYEYIHIGYDNHLAENNFLVIGRDWGHCALLEGRKD